MTTPLVPQSSPSAASDVAGGYGDDWCVTMVIDLSRYGDIHSDQMLSKVRDVGAKFSSN
ncbi:hypothetical protein Tco_0984308, partial [Tanacetum coccineum]